MNEFTKIDLAVLKTALEEARGFGDTQKRLMVKVQSMIDNYCEHENRYFDKECALCVCRDCGEIVNE